MSSLGRAHLRRGLLFVSPWILGFLLFAAYPLVATAVFSLTDGSTVSAPEPVGLRNYGDMAGDALFWKALRNTLAYSALAVPLGTVAAVALATLLTATTRLRGLMRTLFFLPSLVPLVCLALVWKWMLNPGHGLVNRALGTFLGWFGATPPNWLEDARWAMPGLLLATVWCVGQSVIVYLAGMQEIPVSLYEAAEIDGAGFWRKFRHVTLPLLSPYLFFNMVMALIGTLQVFSVPWVMTGGRGAGPDDSLLFMATYIYLNAFEYWNMGYACALSLVLFLVILGLTLAAMRISEKRVHYSGC